MQRDLFILPRYSVDGIGWLLLMLAWRFVDCKGFEGGFGNPVRHHEACGLRLKCLWPK